MDRNGARSFMYGVHFDNGSARGYPSDVKDFCYVGLLIMYYIVMIQLSAIVNFYLIFTCIVFRAVSKNKQILNSDWLKQSCD